MFGSDNGLCEAHLMLRMYQSFSDTKNYGPWKNQQFDFLNGFLKFLTFFESYPPKSEIMFSIELTG